MEHVDGRLEIHPLIRSRPGDFRYSASDVDTMVHEIRHLLVQGAHGVVVGALTPSGDVDVHAIQRLVDAAKEANPEAELTFHRAIDQSRDPLESLERLLDLGFTRVLTSGHAATAGAGLSTLTAMAARAGNALQIMAGGGLTLEDIPAMHRAGLVRCSPLRQEDRLHPRGGHHLPRCPGRQRSHGVHRHRSRSCPGSQGDSERTQSRNAQVAPAVQLPGGQIPVIAHRNDPLRFRGTPG